MVPTIARTWAHRGHTPVLLTAGSLSKVSAISTIMVSPEARRLGLFCRFHPNKNVRAAQVVEFLDHLLHQVTGHVVLLWDRGFPITPRVLGTICINTPGSMFIFCFPMRRSSIPRSTCGAR